MPTPYQACGPSTSSPQPNQAPTETYVTDVQWPLGNPHLEVYRGPGNMTPVVRPLVPNFIISGARISLGTNPNANQLTWASGTYQVGEQRVTTLGGTVQLSNGPAAPNKRIDVLYLNVNGQLQIAQGQPAANPVEDYTQLPNPLYPNALIVGVVGVESDASNTGGYTLTLVNFDTTPPTLPDATTILKGIARLATQAEVNAGVSTNTIVTPATLSAWANPLPSADEHALLWRDDGTWKSSYDGTTFKGLYYTGDNGSNILGVSGTDDAIMVVRDTSTSNSVKLEANPLNITIRNSAGSNSLGIRNNANTNQFQIDNLGPLADYYLRFIPGASLQVGLGSLAGAGTRMVTADANGVLGASPIPAGVPLGGSTNQTMRYDGAGWVATSRLLVPQTGTPTVAGLAGSGTRMVTADGSGVLGTSPIPAGLPLAEQYALAVNQGTTISPSWVDTYDTADNSLLYNNTSSVGSLVMAVGATGGHIRLKTPTANTGQADLQVTAASGEVILNSGEGQLRLQASTTGLGLRHESESSDMLRVGPVSPSSGNPGNDLMYTEFPLYTSQGRLQQKGYPTTSGSMNIGVEVEVVDTSGASGNITRTLPDLSSFSRPDGYRVTVKRKGATHSVVLDTPGSETIDGAATYTLNCDLDAVCLSYDAANSNWDVLFAYITNNCP